MPITHKPKAGALLTGTEYEAGDSHEGTVTVDHDDISGVQTDQHHDQSHTHNGGDFSGTVPHSNLTSITADDHHAQIHASTHATGQPDALTAANVGAAPSTVDYLVGTASGGLSGEIVVGTSPGGELGGTWASPTVDATHSGSSHATATANAIGAYDIERYTTGDLTLNNTTPTAFTGPGDLVVAAASGDLLLLGISARTTNTTNASIGLDFATIVSAAVVNYVSSLTGTPVTTGVPALFLQAAADGVHSGSHVYVVQAGDVSGGTVTLRPYFRTSSSRVLAASSTVPLVFWVKNLKQ